MATPVQSKPSFSPRRKWGIALDVFLRTVVVLAVVGMVNYLSGRYAKRFFLSSQTRIELSPRTLGLVRSLTNEVKVTLYYDKTDPLYSTITALLNEYRYVNPRIRVVTVDYRWDAGEAQKVKSHYKLGEAAENEKNLVIFDCEGRWKIANGNMLADYKLEPVANEKEREFRRKLTAFNGEKMFTAFLLAVTSPKPFRACYLQGHGEHSPISDDEVSGYRKFAILLQQNYVQVEPLTLVGTNTVPMDCNLLIVAGPTKAIGAEELKKISQYLDEGGRLFALFNSAAEDRRTGLETNLVRWDVIVGESPVSDVAHSLKGSDVAVGAFSEHPVVRPLLGSMLDLIAPRPVSKLASKDSAADAPKVEAIVYTEATAVLANDPAPTPQRYPLAVAVEKLAPRGVITERGSTRMIVVGDSFFLANGTIDLYANSDFARYAVNWLLDRTQLVEGIGPQPVTEFRITMTRSQLQTVQWLLLAALPGTILVLGALVGLRRRK